MLSLIGSLQPNPFSPEHTADREPSFVPSSQKHKPESAAPDHLTMLEQLQAEHAEEEGSDVDEPFAMLAKQREEAAEVEELKKKEEKAEKKKRKKEKTKTELAEGTEGEPKKKKKKKEKSVAPP
jgi:DNA-directed RNA polymerase I subunit RPA43